MRSFENARDGINKVFTAIIFQIIAIILGVVASIASKNINIEAFTITDSVAIVSFIALCAIAVVAMILELTGLRQAGKDDRLIFDAFILTILGTVVVITSAVLNAVPILSSDIAKTAINSLDTFGDILSIFSIVLVCFGLCNLLYERKEEKLVKKGRVIAIFFAICFALGAIIELLCSIFSIDKVGVPAIVIVVLAILYTILEVVAYIRFMIYLAQVKNKLA